jgi:DnaJ domain
MPEFLLGVVALLLLLWAASALVKADPKRVARVLRWIGGGAALLFARSTGQASNGLTAYLEMELDHDTGRMNGRVLAGSYQGAALDALDQVTLMKLLREIDDDSRDLLAAYLDRREPGWREYAQRDAGAGARAAGGNMSEEEAYQILGLQPGATVEEISRAHRSLIKKLHPDQGGTTYLAARINEAKDVLLRYHR